MKLDHIAIQVEDINLSIEWYQEKFNNIEIQYSDATWAMILIGTTKLALTVADLHPPHIAFEIQNLSEFPTGEIKHHRDGSAYIYIKDPSGNIIEYIYYP